MEIKNWRGDVIFQIAGESLRGANLTGADFSRADLTGAVLTDATFTDAKALIGALRVKLVVV